MIVDLNIPISTQLIYDHKKNKVFPHKIQWKGNTYTITSIGLHYSYKKGKTLFHVFTASTEALSFKLLLNTDNLFWTLEQISDGEPD